MEKTISEQIKDYAKANPLASESEVRAHFNVSRQLVSQMFHQLYTSEELAARKHMRLNESADTIKGMLIAKKTHVEICKELGICKSKLKRIIDSNPELIEISKKNDQSDYDRVVNISYDWNAGMSLAELTEKYNIGKTPTSAASYISKLRTRHGVDLFPLRLDNQVSLEEKFNKYKELHSNGMSPEEISKILGYKTLLSMKSAFVAFNRKVKEDDART